MGDDRGLGPVEVPTVFDGHDGVLARNDVGEAEAAIQITLVAAEQFVIRFGA